MIEIKIEYRYLTEDVAARLGELILALGEAQTEEVGVPAPVRSSGHTKPDDPKTPPKPVSFKVFRAGLTPNTREFLRIVEAAGGHMVIKPVIEKQLGIKDKAIGGLYGAMMRKAANHNVVIPLVKTTNPQGVRAWQWTA